jgi:hypothetical protein
MFYSTYKNFVYERFNNKYMVADIRVVPLPTNESEMLENWKEFEGYSKIDGLIWQYKTGPTV